MARDIAKRPAGIRPDVWQAYLEAPSHLVAEFSKVS
jgi:hypothetical protein